MSYLPSHPQGAPFTRHCFFGQLDSLHSEMAPQSNFHNLLAKQSDYRRAPFTHNLENSRPPYHQSKASFSNTSSVHTSRNLGSMAPLLAPAYPMIVSKTMDKISHPHHAMSTPMFPLGLPTVKSAYSSSATIPSDGHLQPSTFTALPFPTPASALPSMSSQGYHPSLTPIVEVSPHVKSPRSMERSHLRKDFLPPPYNTAVPAPINTTAINLGHFALSHAFSGSIDPNGVTRTSAESTSHLFHSNSPSPASTPRTQHSIDSSSATRHRALSRKLSLGPPEDMDDIVEILIPTNDAGAVQGFPVHSKLLAHFSSLMKAHLQITTTATEKDRKKIAKALKIKGFNYQNELAFHHRVRAGPSDFDDDPDVGGWDEHPAEDSIVTVPVVTALPEPFLQPQKICLPKEVGSVNPKTFAALISWLYLGEGFVNDAKAVVMIELWVLAGKMDIKACQNDCVVGIEKERQSRNVVEVGMMEWAWKNTTNWTDAKPATQMLSVESTGSTGVEAMGEGSENSTSRQGCPLRNLLIDQCAWFLDEKWLDGVSETGTRNQDVLGMAVLVDLVARLRALHREGGFNAPGLHELLQIEKRIGERYWVLEE